MRYTFLMEADLNQSRPSEEPNSQVPSPSPSPSPSPAESSAPGAGAALRLNQLVLDALSKAPGGKQLDEYFGISGGVPKQSPAGVRESERCIEILETVHMERPYFSRPLDPMANQILPSKLDPELIRALTQPRKKADQ